MNYQANYQTRRVQHTLSTHAAKLWPTPIHITPDRVHASRAIGKGCSRTRANRGRGEGKGEGRCGGRERGERERGSLGGRSVGEPWSGLEGLEGRVKGCGARLEGPGGGSLGAASPDEARRGMVPRGPGRPCAGLCRHSWPAQPRCAKMSCWRG